VKKHSGRRVFARLGWFAALCYMGGIFLLSSIPGDDLPLPQFFLSDKIAHFVTYAGLGVLIAFRAGLTAKLRGLPVTQWTKGGWIGPTVGLLYAVFDEFHQSWVPNRDPAAGDFVADTLGLLLGFWLARRWDTKKVRSEK
jgi:VanZ family protein